MDFRRRSCGWARNGINPLEFPGPHRVAGHQHGRAWPACSPRLAAVFLACVFIGERLAGEGSLRGAAGLLVWSIVPIALAYHFSHYLTALLVNAQYAVVALSDPFALGWNLFGTAHMPVSAGIATGSNEAARLIWNAQAFAIIWRGMCWRCWSRTGSPSRLHADRAGGAFPPVAADPADDRLHGVRPLAAVDADGWWREACASQHCRDRLPCEHSKD